MNIGRVRLGSSPLIVAIAHDQIPLKSLKTLNKNADLIEVRIDLFHSINCESVIKFLKNLRDLTKLPVIGTIRKPVDGGKRYISDQNRHHLFKTIMPLIDCIDTEIESPICEELVKEAQEKKKKVIISYHNFKETPSTQKLLKLIQKGKSKGGDIIKLAVMCNKEEDLFRLLAFTKKYRKVNLITISLGKMGRISRIITPLFGSLFTYGYIDSPIALGQFSIFELRRILKLFYNK